MIKPDLLSGQFSHCVSERGKHEKSYYITIKLCIYEPRVVLAMYETRVSVSHNSMRAMVSHAYPLLVNSF
jgi:hypothetical protein